MRAQDLMSQPPITCRVNDTLYAAAKLMWDHDCGVLPVINDEGKVTGMLTDRDICMAAFTQGMPLDSILVNIAMAKHPVLARPDQSIGDIEVLMARHQIRRLPVVDADGRPLGVISLNDIALESAQPDSRVKHGISKVAQTLAAISAHRRNQDRAA